MSPDQNTIETFSQNYRDNNNDIAHHHFIFEVLITACENGFLELLSFFSLEYNQQVRQQSNIADVVMKSHCHSSH